MLKPKTISKRLTHFLNIHKSGIRKCQQKPTRWQLSNLLGQTRRNFTAASHASNTQSKVGRSVSKNVWHTEWWYSALSRVSSSRESEKTSAACLVSKNPIDPIVLMSKNNDRAIKSTGADARSSKTNIDPYSIISTLATALWNISIQCNSQQAILKVGFFHFSVKYRESCIFPRALTDSFLGSSLYLYEKSFTVLRRVPILNRGGPWLSLIRPHIYTPCRHTNLKIIIEKRLCETPAALCSSAVLLLLLN